MRSSLAKTPWLPAGAPWPQLRLVRASGLVSVGMLGCLIACATSAGVPKNRSLADEPGPRVAKAPGLFVTPPGGPVPIEADADASDLVGLPGEAPVGATIRRGRYTLVPPYPLDSLMRGFKGCRRGKRVHPAVDIGGTGPHCGLGTPVRSMVRARVERIGLPEEEPALYGRPDKRAGFATRCKVKLPRSLRVPGYGRVYFFTLNKGHSRSGTTIVLHGLGGGLDGYRIRYMHLGAVHPDLSVGSIVEAGDEIGLMGCSAVQQSPPHLHLDAFSPEGVPLDLKGLFIGKPLQSARCPTPIRKSAHRKGKSQNQRVD